MRLGLTVSAGVALYLERPSMALVFAVLAIAWAIPRPRGAVSKWLGWQEAVARAEGDETLFSGRREDP